MTQLLDSIERHLERVRTIEAASIPDAGVGPDLAHHEATLVALFERAEAAGKKEPALWVDLLGAYLDGLLEQLVEFIYWDLLAVFGANLDASMRQRLIDWALAQDSGLADLSVVPPPSKSMQTWLERRETEFEDVGRGWPTRNDNDFPWRIVSRYCERIGLVTARPEAPRLRMPGQIWLRLRGLDRLRWLLALEAEYAVSDDDPWRASNEQAAGIIRNAGRLLAPVLMDEVVQADLPNGSGACRWAAFGLIKLASKKSRPNTARYHLTPTGEQLLRHDADINELFRNLAHAQAQDDRSDVLRPEATTPSSSDLTVTTLRHARLVAHEVRNALLPVRHALGKVWRTLDNTELARSLASPREQIEQGITRLYDFVEASARMSAPVEELSTTFFVLDAIDEARRAIPELPGVRLITIPGSANPRCRGNRARFVLVLLNLMRNAIQAAGPSVALTITVTVGADESVELTIDDDGPGIPEHMHDHLFQNGTSSRPDGTGHGLALAREVMERELGGSIAHEPGPGGGARFRLTLPSPEANRG
jgi:signal transduction histidine kinase